MVGKDESVSKQWSKVQSAYQLRADKIKSIAATVKAAAKFEKGTLVEVVEARAGKAREAQIDPSKLSTEELKKYQAIQQDLTKEYKNFINVVVEQYPQLTATQNFRDLSNEISESENMIKVERDRFGEALNVYNKSVRKFPGNIFAGLFGFQHKDYFLSDPGAEKAPDVGKILE